MYPSLKSRTERLLFACARAQEDDVRRDEVAELIERGVDFEYLCFLAADHHVSALLFDALKSCEPSSDPEKKAIKSLRVSCLASEAANSFYKEELMKILANFAERDIPVIPLKGILLSEYLYGNIESRDKSADIDLLVKEDDARRARSALEDIGYAFKPVGEIKEYTWYYSFVKPGFPEIDLHLDITMMVRSRRRIDGMWSFARTADISGVKYYYFKPEEMLLYLSAHLVNSGAFRQLRHIRDIERLIKKYGNGIDWNSVIRKAREWRLSGSLYTALILIERSSGFKFPREILREIKISATKRFFIRSFADKKVVAGRGFRRKFLDIFLSYIFFEIVEAASFKDYRGIFKRIFLPPREKVGETGYGLRIFKGAVKMARRIIT